MPVPAVRSPLGLMTYPPRAGSVRAARRFAEEQLVGAGLAHLADDAGLLVSELAANAVLHARTDFDVVLYASPNGARLEVRDRSELPPVFTAPSATAMSGRGLALVRTLAARWGHQSSPAGGKQVWFEMDEAIDLVEVDVSVEDLLALWAEPDDLATTTTSPGPSASGASAAAPAPGERAAPGAGAVEVAVADLPARELLAAKEHMDDLLRELQLVLLDGGDGRPGASSSDAGRSAPSVHVLAVAADLDAAARAFEVVRRQVREQVTRAAAQGLELVSVHLQLPAGAGAAAVAYRAAVQAAEDLLSDGVLLTAADDLGRHAAVRRSYLEAVISASPAG